MRVPGCVLCSLSPEEAVWHDSRLMVITGGADGLGEVARVVWRAHVAEMSTLAAADRQYLMDVVFTVEAAVRDLAGPLKMNIASLGNVVPHLHWHVIPRYADDAFFPDSIWSKPRRTGVVREIGRGRLAAALAARLPGAGDSILSL
ncbi:MAG: HIT family protein [Gammaproteobacteria bacterium]|nr:HIT family protein [Gammaproteobacteria bacterium]